MKPNFFIFFIFSFFQHFLFKFFHFLKKFFPFFFLFFFSFCFLFFIISVFQCFSFVHFFHFFIFPFFFFFLFSFCRGLEIRFFFFWPLLLQDFLLHFFSKKSFFEPSRGSTSLGLLFIFSRVLKKNSFSCLSYYFSFSFFIFSQEKSFFFSFFLYFFQICFIACISIRV